LEAEWLVERGIGEDRAILVAQDQVLAARIQLSGKLAAGFVGDARLISRSAGSRRGTLLFENGEEALVDALPPDAREGAPLRAIVMRAAMAEVGRYKRAHARPSNDAPRAAPDLAQALGSKGTPVRIVRRFAHDPWPDIAEEALSGHVAFTTGGLIVSPTPAMTLIDIDGSLPALPLALAAVQAIAATLARLDVAGSIGIDFPTIESRTDRHRVDEALDHALAGWPHERTAMNGFGFVQLISRLERPSILTLVRSNPARIGAMLLLRRIEDVSSPGVILAVAHPDVLAALTSTWRHEITRRTGRTISWQPDPALAPLGGFAQAISS
jgi:hypothetical protein